jgi:hypothetical protein
LDYIIICSYM